MKRQAIILFSLAMWFGAQAVRSADTAESKIREGMELYKNHKMEEASVAFEAALANDNSRAQRRLIYLYLGKSYESSGRLDKAIASYEQAAEYDRKNWRRHRDLAGLYEQAELYAKAVTSYNTALKLEPKEPSIFLGLGRTWREIGIYSYAESWLNKAMASGQYGDDVKKQFSLVYEGQGRFAEAATASLNSTDDPKRALYLAAMSGDPALIDQARQKLAKAGLSRATVQSYENLVQLIKQPAKDILAGRTDDPALQALFRSQFSEGTTQ